MKARTLWMAGFLAWLAAASSTSSADEPPKHALPVSADGNVVVGLCDGQTSMEVKGVKDGAAMSRTQAQSVSDALMREWKKKHPDAHWDEESARAELLAQQGNVPGGGRTDTSAHGATTPPKGAAPPQGNANTAQPGVGPNAGQGAAAAAQAQGAKVQAQTYGAFDQRDQQIWQASTQQFVDEGNKIFHDAKALGGTIGVSCDMCHPNAANTHPETYPKYQVQLGRVALLRDMINWCIENPVRGKPLHDDDPKLKALEAFIYAQRKGVALEYGKH